MTELSVACDLRTLFGEARDQGERTTCLAFAASDAHAALRAGWKPLSCEYAFYHAQRRGGRGPTVGARLPDMLDALRDDGQPREENWPYLDAPPVDLQKWRPPADVGDVYRRLGAARPNSFDEIIRSLDGGAPILVLMYLSMSFYIGGVDGVIMPAAGEDPDYTLRHAVIAVGHGEIGGERAILVRNSWGTAWGDQGYAWLIESYLAPLLMRLAALTEELNVPVDRQAA